MRTLTKLSCRIEADSLYFGVLLLIYGAEEYPLNYILGNTFFFIF